MATANKVRIRRARPLDVSNLCRLLMEGQQETQSALGEPDEGRLAALVLDLIQNGYVSVAEISGRLVAVLAFAGYQPGYTLQWVLDCEWFYLKPSLRQTGLGLAMLTRALDVADKFGASVRLGVCPMDGEELTDKVMKKLNFRATHRVYVREANNERRREDDTNTEPESVVRSGGEGDATASPDPEPEAL